MFEFRFYVECRYFTSSCDVCVSLDMVLGLFAVVLGCLGIKRTAFCKSIPRTIKILSVTMVP